MRKRKLTAYLTVFAVMAATAFNSGIANLSPCYGEDNPFVIENNVLVSYSGDEETVVVPDGVVEIGEYAFRDAKNVRYVTLPDSLEKISKGAFVNSSTLEKINIPKNVQEIGAIAFAGCYSLSPILIESEDVEIGSSAFEGCYGLSDNEGYIVVNGILFDRFYYGSEKHWTLPENVKRIDGKFEELYIKSLSIPDGCEEIGDNAILLCPVLDELVIPATVTVIEDYAISDCNKDMIVYGYKNSAAQEYAQKNNMNFRILGVDGDADCNGELSLDDANYVLQAALGIKELKYVEASIANIDKEDGVTLNDANATLKLALGIVSMEDILLENMD